MRIIILLILNLFSLVIRGQDKDILTLKDFIATVKDHHPITYKADILIESAISQKQIARGGFDPKIEADWAKKSFDDKNYFSIAQSKVKIPSWYGIDFGAGYDRNSGEFLNNSDFIPTRGLWNAGISIPIGRGLIIDKRRAELKKADILKSVSEQERKLMINKLLYEAVLSYVDWQVAAEYLSIATEGLSLSLVRFEGTKSSFINGDKPAIDTLESFINYQSRQLEFQKANQILQNKRIEISNFIWLEGQTPIDLLDNIVPETIDVDLFSIQVDSISLDQNLQIETHPNLLIYKYKLASLDIDQKVAKEDLKPDLRLSYNPLVGVANDALFDQFRIDNYKLGATLVYPILQRKERGKIQLNKLKIQDTQYDKKLKSQEITVKSNLYLNNINQSRNQYNLLDEVVLNYNKLLIGEERKFAVGESSLFLINSRETKYLDSKYKIVELINKVISYRLTYMFIGASLPEVI